MPYLAVLLFIVIVGCDGWVYRDAKQHVAHGDAVMATIGPVTIDTPTAWAVVCLVTFVVSFPLYLVARSSN